jgi:uncharacterized protein (TIGR02452 family)
MDIKRIENMHRAKDVIEIQQRKSHPAPSVSIKFDTEIFDINVCEDPIYDDTDIEIENIDTITAALREIKAGRRVLILNMANAYKPGGGFATGAKAQEEDLFRSMDLYTTLTPDLYPMQYNQIIYTPKAHIIKDANYETLEQPVEVGVVSVAAFDNPHVDNYGMLSEYIHEMTSEKIRMIYHLGLVQKYDCLILGALGCGAFNNPPHEIAGMFCDITEDYVQRYEKIVFPIKCDEYNANCDIFQSAFLEVFS